MANLSLRRNAVPLALSALIWAGGAGFSIFGQETKQETKKDPLQAARAFLAAGDLDQAKASAAAALKQTPPLTEAHFVLGYILFKQKDPKASLAEYTEGAKYRKPTPADLEVVASDYVLLDDYEDADRWYTKALEWNPKDPLGWYYLGRVKYNENRFEEAIHAFAECLRQDPKNVKAEDNLGLSYQGLGKNAEAAAAYRQAIEWQSGAPVKDSGPYLNLGTLLADGEKPSEGLPFLQEAASISPQDFRTHRQLGKAYQRTGNLESAQAEMRKAIELAPDQAPLHFMLAQIYQKRGMKEEARAETARYTQLNEAQKK